MAPRKSSAPDPVLPDPLYSQVIKRIFEKHFKPGLEEFEFAREELETAATELHSEGRTRTARVKNLGDIIYTYRYRRPFPAKVTDAAPSGRSWIILGAGDACYRFRLTKLVTLVPRAGQEVIPLPDATPEIIKKYAQGDEQALLAKVRYNRLVDTFLRLNTYPLQSHLRTKIENYGQIEIDELYVGLDSAGKHYVIPVQAKGPRDQLGAIQTIQDVTFCQKAFPQLECRPVSAQLLRDADGEVLALFELGFDGNDVTVREERHYRLVDADQTPLRAR